MRLALVIGELRERVDADGRLSIGQILDAFQARVYGPLLMIPAIIAVFPVVGALPGVSITVALIMTLVSLQLALGLRQPWLPRRLKRVSLSEKNARAVLRGAEPWARRFDVFLRPRFDFLFHRPGIYATGALCLAVALLALIGALAPGLIVLPALTMILLAFALIAHDGWLLAACAVLTGGLTAAGYWAVGRINWPDWIPLLGH